MPEPLFAHAPGSGRPSFPSARSDRLFSGFFMPRPAIRPRKARAAPAQGRLRLQPKPLYLRTAGAPSRFRRCPPFMLRPPSDRRFHRLTGSQPAKAPPRLDLGCGSLPQAGPRGSRRPLAPPRFAAHVPACTGGPVVAHSCLRICMGIMRRYGPRLKPRQPCSIFTHAAPSSLSPRTTAWPISREESMLVCASLSDMLRAITSMSSGAVSRWTIL